MPKRTQALSQQPAFSPPALADDVLRCMYELQFDGRRMLVPTKNADTASLSWRPAEDGRTIRCHKVPAIVLLAEFYEPRTNPIAFCVDPLVTALRYLERARSIEPAAVQRGEAETWKGLQVQVENSIYNFVRRDGLFVTKAHWFPPPRPDEIPSWMTPALTRDKLRASLCLGGSDRVAVDVVSVADSPIYWVLRRFDRLAGQIMQSPALQYVLGMPAAQSGIPADENYAITEKGIELCSAVPDANTATGPRLTTGKSKRGMPKNEANIRAREALNKNAHLTQRQLADEIPCSTGLVSKLSAWQAVQAERKKGRKPKTPKAVGLTGPLQATVGANDPELERLIGEQGKDYEPSPLAEDPPDKPVRRVKSHRRT